MCRICNYNQVKDLDRLLLAGVTPVELSRKYAFTSAELQNHQQHLQQKMALVSQRFHASLDQGLFCQLHTVMAMVLSVVGRTVSGDDPKLFLQASREFTRILSLMHKMSARLQFDPEFIHCLMASHEWDLQEANLLPNALQALNRSRQTMKLYLFAPCPEPEPASAPATRHPSGETLTADRSPDPLLQAATVFARPNCSEPVIGKPPRN